VLVFTDGADTTSWTAPRTLLEAASRSNIVIYVVSLASTGSAGPTDGAQAFRSLPVLRSLLLDDPRLFPHAFAHELADRTGGEVLAVNDSKSLAATFARIVQDFKSRYLLTFTPAGVPASGWHPLQVDLKGVDGNVRARRGYSR
jgi:VWFA-related protein